MKIDGRQIAQEILNDLKTKIANQKTRPHLAIIIVGNNRASLSYVKQKQLKAKEVGIETTLISLDDKTSQEKLISEIDRLNNNSAISGIIVQKPLPKQIDSEKVNLAISSEKDIDGFNPNSKFTSPIGLSILEVLKKANQDINNLKDKKIAILGKGETGGKPIKQVLLKFGANPIVIDSKTENPEEIIKSSDIVISAVGKKEVITSSILKKGVLLIGAGQHLEENGQFKGDYEEESVKDITSFYTTTPGGIGPINVAMLLRNLVIG